MRSIGVSVIVVLALVMAFPAIAGKTNLVEKVAVKDKYAPRVGDVQIELEAFTLTDAPVVDLEVASGGKAVSFPTDKARAETTVTLPKGAYKVELYLMGRSLDHDTVFVKIGDAEPAKTFPSHPSLPMVTFWQSMVGGRTNAVTITVTDERQTIPVVITPKETEMDLDRIIFRLQTPTKGK